MIRIITGNSAIVIPAAKYPHSILYKEMNWYSATWNRVELGEFASTIGRTNSFQEKIKENIDATAKPGIDNGMIILLNTPILEHPSINADSSNSFGIVSK